MSDANRPREHDHLVEPLFGGLGADSGKEPGSAASDAPPGKGAGSPAAEPRRALLWIGLLIALGSAACVLLAT